MKWIGFIAPLAVLSVSCCAQSDSNGRTFSVAHYNAVGDGSHDDTDSIQAAFDDCWNGGTGVQPYGGTVQFPGNHTYKISRTINAHDSCRIVGELNGALATGSQALVNIRWNGPPAGEVIPVSGFTVAANTSYFPPSSLCVKAPCGSSGTRAPAYACSITVPTSTPPPVGTWILLQGFKGAGYQYNSAVSQVAAVSPGASFTTAETWCPAKGTFTDIGIATTINVAIAFDSYARQIQEVNSIELANESGIPAANRFGVGLYFGSRVDSGTRVYNSWISGALYYNFYFADGGIDVNFDGGSRSDGVTNPGGSLIYWRVGGVDEFSIEGSMSLSSQTIPPIPSGAYITADNSGCISGGQAFLSLRDLRNEIDNSIAQAQGALHLLACPTTNTPQFFIHEDTVDNSAAANSSQGVWTPSIVVTPPSSNALVLDVSASVIPFGNVKNETKPFVGLPGLGRFNMTGTLGVTPWTCLGNAFNSEGFTGGVVRGYAPCQIFGDFNQSDGLMYHDKVQAAPFLYSDTAFNQLPNATTLFAGEILAPPSYWKGVNGKRYALNVVYTAGTTGTPNGGSTACTGSGTTVTCAGPHAGVLSTSCAGDVLTVTTAPNSFTAGGGDEITLVDTAEAFLNGGTWRSSQATPTSVSMSYQCDGFAGNANEPSKATATISATTDLEPGQFITLGSAHTQIRSINAFNPLLVTLATSSRLGVINTPTALTFTAPVLATEIQLLTKANAAPTSGTWAQGDYVENSGAAANGVAGWVCTAAGTPGTWEPIAVQGVTAGAPIVGQAACVKAAGPPVVMGYCTTAVNSSGACGCK